MNSEKLKNKFKNEYKDFFRENNKVFSLPLNLNWVSDINEEYKGIHIKQKIPLRIYVWVNKIKKHKIIFNKINYFDINEDNFIKEKMVEYSPVISEIKDFFDEQYEIKNNFNHWLEFNILAEMWKWQGSGFISILSALLIILYKNNYNEEYFNIKEKIAKKSDKIIDILNDDNFYNDLLKTTLKINKYIERPLSIVNQISSLFDWRYPIVSFVQKNYKTQDPEKIKFFWYRINDLNEKIPKIPYIPIDYWLIYTGMPVSSSQILYSYMNSDKKENKVLKNISDFFCNDISGLDDNDKPSFSIKFLNKKSFIERNKAFVEIYLSLMWTLSLKILNNFVDFYKKPYDEYLSKKFLENVKKITRFNLLTKKCSIHFKKFMQEIINNFKDSYLDLAIAPNDTMLMWWNAIFAMNVEWNRWKLLNTIKEINKTNYWVKLTYANWLDWVEKRWLIVEQDINDKIFSEFIDNNSLLLIDSNWNKKIIWNNFFEMEDYKNWLFLDLTKNKILFNWNKLTSKELKSQNTTIEVLVKLLENKWDYISNKDLSLSSYSTNKNDMISKIIWPLEKLIKLENNIYFKIICTWTISNFKIKLEETDLEIYIIKHLN